MRRLKQSGIAGLEVLLVILLLAIVGFTGYYVWRAQNNTNKTLTATSTAGSSIVSSASKPAVPAAADKTYTNDDYSFSFKYPSNWKLVTDLKDIGRGGLEGELYVESPNGTKVHFAPNFGGKGGDCADEKANDQRTTRTCTTRTVLTVNKLAATKQDVYFVKASDTAPTDDGGKTTYFIYLASDYEGSSFGHPEVGSIVGVFLGTYDDVWLKKVNLTVSVEGKDDNKNSTSAFFETAEVKEATPILKSFTVL